MHLSFLIFFFKASIHRFREFVCIFSSLTNFNEKISTDGYEQGWNGYRFFFVFNRHYISLAFKHFCWSVAFNFNFIQKVSPRNNTRNGKKVGASERQHKQNAKFKEKQSPKILCNQVLNEVMKSEVIIQPVFNNQKLHCLSLNQLIECNQFCMEHLIRLLS